MIDVDPSNIKARYRRGQAHSAIGNLEEAVKDLQVASHASPSDQAIAVCANAARPADSHFAPQLPTLVLLHHDQPFPPALPCLRLTLVAIPLPGVLAYPFAPSFPESLFHPCEYSGPLHSPAPCHILGD